MIRIIDVIYTDEPQMRPENAEFGVKVDFTRGQSDPVQVFSAMTDLLAGFVAMDRALAHSLDPESEALTVIEDVEAASLITWLKSTVTKVDDDALKSLDWRKQFGPYAVKAKYRIIKYLDDREAVGKTKRLDRLLHDLSELADREMGRPSLLPARPNVPDLIEAMNKVQSAKTKFGPNEKVIVQSDIVHEAVTLDLESNAQIDRAEVQAAVAATGGGDTQMVLLIRRPDFLGRAQWDFKHGTTNIKAKVSDEEWLAQFHRGQVMIVPGALMKALVRCTYDYDGRGDLIGSDFEVLDVVEIIPPSVADQQHLFGA